MARLRSSSRGLFLQCERKYFYEYVLGKVPIKKSAPLSFGTLAHECREHFYNTKGDTNIQPLIDAWYSEQINAIEASPYAMFGADADLKKLADHKTLIEQIMPPYFEERVKDFDEFNIIGVEHAFKIDIGGHDFCGSIDLVFEKKKSGAIYIDDFKTTSIGINRYLEHVFYNVNQSAAYLYAARELFGRVDGVVYDVLLKQFPKPVRTTQCKKCKGRGVTEKTVKDDAGEPFVESVSECLPCNGTGVGDISKTTTDTTKEMLDAFFIDHPHISKEDHKSLYVTACGKKYRTRETIPVNNRQIDEWASETIAVGDRVDALAEKDRSKYLRNLGHCLAYNTRCSYADNCVLGSDEWHEFSDRVDPYASM